MKPIISQQNQTDLAVAARNLDRALRHIRKVQDAVNFRGERTYFETVDLEEAAAKTEDARSWVYCFLNNATLILGANRGERTRNQARKK